MLTALHTLFWISLAVVAYTYVIYPLALPLLAVLFGRRDNADDGSVPSVGVVIPVYNEESVIAAKIRNLLAVDYPAGKLSLWIGSDCSTDRTHEIVKGFADPRVRLWIAPARGGKTGVINQLTPQVPAEVVLFTDANTMHRADSVRRLARHFADPRVGGAAGHIDHCPRTDKRFGETFYRRFESRQKQLESALHSTISAYGGFYAIRKELFRQIPANAYSNDDVLIPMNVVRNGTRMVFDASAVSEEDSTGSIPLEFRRRVRIGAGNFQAFFWLLDFLNPLRGWPFFCFVSHKVCRWFSPLFIVLGLASCGALACIGGGPVYTALIAAAGVMVAAGLSFAIAPMRYSKYIFYFLTMNAALILGFFRYAGGIRSAAWARTERSG